MVLLEICGWGRYRQIQKLEWQESSIRIADPFPQLNDQPQTPVDGQLKGVEPAHHKEQAQVHSSKDRPDAGACEKRGASQPRTQHCQAQTQVDYSFPESIHQKRYADALGPQKFTSQLSEYSLLDRKVRAESLRNLQSV